MQPGAFRLPPYTFNHGLDSSPVALFYDGGVRQLPNMEVLLADFQVLNSTGQTDGLWHRGTPLGTDGYFISEGYDFSPLSHHVLTTDGILGRDTLGGMSPLPQRVKASLRGAGGKRRPGFAAEALDAPGLPRFTPQQAQP